jgi:hypothetical protein
VVEAVGGLPVSAHFRPKYREKITKRPEKSPLTCI